MSRWRLEWLDAEALQCWEELVDFWTSPKSRSEMSKGNTRHKVELTTKEAVPAGPKREGEANPLGWNGSSCSIWV